MGFSQKFCFVIVFVFLFLWASSLLDLVGMKFSEMVLNNSYRTSGGFFIRSLCCVTSLHHKLKFWISRWLTVISADYHYFCLLEWAWQTWVTNTVMSIYVHSFLLCDWDWKSVCETNIGKPMLGNQHWCETSIPKGHMTFGNRCFTSMLVFKWLAVRQSHCWFLKK